MSYFLECFFFTFLVSEGALGLSILVSMIRTHGNDYFQSLVFYNVKVTFCFGFFSSCVSGKKYMMNGSSIVVFTDFYFYIYECFSTLIGNLSYFLGCDVLSNGLILLSFWICVLMITASESVYRFSNYEGFFILMIVILLVLLFCAFSCMNLFMFYLFFEKSLIPTLFLILGWGYQPERLQAGVYLLFYTLLASLAYLS